LLRLLPALVALSTLLAAEPLRAEGPSGRYTVDPHASELTVFVKKKGALKAFAHDHEMVARVFSGSVAWDRAAPERSSVAFAVDAREIVVLDPQLSESDRASVQKTMRGPEVLSVDKYPEIAFSSESVVAHEKDGSGRVPLSVTGRLTLHGVARQTTLQVLLAETKEHELTVTGEHGIKQSDHGIEPYSAAFGTIAVEDLVTVKFRVVAREAEGVAKDGGR
jgi:polyisoprenoid-binding protein YceI